MYKFVLSTIFSLWFIVFGFAQQTKSSFFVTGKIKVEQGTVDKSVIKVFCDNQLIETITINSTGNFRIGININHIYRFEVGKEGFYPKTIEFNSNVPNEVCSDNCNFPPYQLSILLYKSVPGVKEISSQVGRISYNQKTDGFDAEMLRENEQKPDVKSMIDQIKAQSIAYEKQAASAKDNKYRLAVADADRLSNEKKYEEAMYRYRDAVMIYPEIVYPRNRVNQLYQIIVSEQLDKSIGKPSVDNLSQLLNYGDRKYNEKEYSMAKIAYEKALQIKPNDETARDRLYKVNIELMNLSDLAITEANHRKKVYETRIVKYNELIAKADQKFLSLDYAEAKDLYAQAVTQISENSYSLLMIKKIDDILVNDDAALKLAREREEAEKKRLREARNKAYSDAVAEADRLFSERLYRDAQEYYELALTVKDFEPYPQQQLRIIRGILAQIQLKGEEYNNLLRDAEALLNNKLYPDARALYVKAHELIPNEQFALGKINYIDLLLLKLLNEENNNLEYNKYIKIAEEHTESKQYLLAIAAYQEALKLKPSEELPKVKIRELRDLISKESNEQKKAMQLQNEYDRLVALADEAFNRQLYPQAKNWYGEALRVIAGQEYPISQISKIDALLKEREATNNAKSNLEQIDFSKLDNISANLRKAAYEEAMQLGNSFIQTEEWSLARFYFRRALMLYTSDQPATQKLAFVETKIRVGNVDEAKFNELISKADEAFKTGDFSVSKFYYTKAKEIKPDNAYTLERLQVVTKLAETSAARNANDEYNEAISKGNEALEAKNYAVARFFFRRALSLKPSDDVAKTKIAQVESLLKK